VNIGSSLNFRIPLYFLASNPIITFSLKSFFSKVRYEVRNISQGQQLYPVDKKTNIAQFSVLCAKQAR